MGIIEGIKSIPMLIAIAALAALGIYAGVQHNGKLKAEAKVEERDRAIGAAQASIEQWHSSATACSKATEALAAKLATKQGELDQVAAVKVRVVIQRQLIGRQAVAGADRSKSCGQAVRDFVASFQRPQTMVLPTSAKSEVRP